MSGTWVLTGNMRSVVDQVIVHIVVPHRITVIPSIPLKKTVSGSDDIVRGCIIVRYSVELNVVSVTRELSGIARRNVCIEFVAVRAVSR